MSRGSGVEVSLPDLDRHTSEVSTIADDVRSCAQRSDAMGGVDFRAWGLVGQVFHGAVEHWIHHANSLLHTCADAADDIGGRLTAAHEDYSNNEQATADEFDGIRTGGGSA
jgi:hypothetical protein